MHVTMATVKRTLKMKYIFWLIINLELFYLRTLKWEVKRTYSIKVIVVLPSTMFCNVVYFTLEGLFYIINHR